MEHQDKASDRVASQTSEAGVSEVGMAMQGDNSIRRDSMGQV